MKKLMVSILFLSSMCFAQSSIEIHGTSTLHDWKMVSQTIDVGAFESEGGVISALDVGVQIETLKSGDSGLDKKAYEALKIDKSNVITFSLKEHNAENKTIRGVFKVLDMEREETLTPEIIETNRVAGSFEVKMTDFGITPPSVMFGAIKSGDAVTVKYDIQK
jgi:hypothetical protein